MEQIMAATAFATQHIRSASARPLESAVICPLRKLFEQFCEPLGNRLRESVMRLQLLRDKPLNLMPERNFFAARNQISFYHGTDSAASSPQVSAPCYAVPPHLANMPAL
jgi:hypothetical protein